MLYKCFIWIPFSKRQACLPLAEIPSQTSELRMRCWRVWRFLCTLNLKKWLVPPDGTFGNKPINCFPALSCIRRVHFYKCGVERCLNIYKYIFHSMFLLKTKYTSIDFILLYLTLKYALFWGTCLYSLHFLFPTTHLNSPIYLLQHESSIYNHQVCHLEMTVTRSLSLLDIFTIYLL